MKKLKQSILKVICLTTFLINFPSYADLLSQINSIKENTTSQIIESELNIQTIGTGVYGLLENTNKNSALAGIYLRCTPDVKYSTMNSHTLEIGYMTNSVKFSKGVKFSIKKDGRHKNIRSSRGIDYRFSEDLYGKINNMEFSGLKGWKTKGTNENILNGNTFRIKGKVRLSSGQEIDIMEEFRIANARNEVIKLKDTCANIAIARLDTDKVDAINRVENQIKKAEAENKAAIELARHKTAIKSEELRLKIEKENMISKAAKEQALLDEKLANQAKLARQKEQKRIELENKNDVSKLEKETKVISSFETPTSLSNAVNLIRTNRVFEGSGLPINNYSGYYIAQALGNNLFRLDSVNGSQEMLLISDKQLFEDQSLENAGEYFQYIGPKILGGEAGVSGSKQVLVIKALK